jgi:hypothetical protein
VTPDDLRALADAATPGPWEQVGPKTGLGKPGVYVRFHFGGGRSFETFVHSAENARLIALAPDLARLVAELGEALEEIAHLDEQVDDDNLHGSLIARLALAKLAELEAR